MLISNNKYINSQTITTEPTGIVSKGKFQTASTITQNSGEAGKESCWSSFKNKVVHIWNQFVSWIKGLCCKETRSESKHVKSEKKDETKSEGKKAVGEIQANRPIPPTLLKRNTINGGQEVIIVRSEIDDKGHWHYYMQEPGRHNIKVLGYMEIFVDPAQNCVCIQQLMFFQNDPEQLLLTACEYSLFACMEGRVEANVSSDYQRYVKNGFWSDEGSYNHGKLVPIMDLIQDNPKGNYGTVKMYLRQEFIEANRAKISAFASL